MKDFKIECPVCKWEPDGGPYWGCICGNIWNTFDTQGVCPQCGKRWINTQCPGPGYPGGCGQWSLHIDWYKIPSGMRELIEEINLPITAS